jgi:hypothetical protein
MILVVALILSLGGLVVVKMVVEVRGVLTVYSQTLPQLQM